MTDGSPLLVQQSALQLRRTTLNRVKSREAKRSWIAQEDHNCAILH